jgi:hypothetical protein
VNIRYWCVIGPGIPRHYLVAFKEAFEVRAIPIGGMFMGSPNDDWAKVESCFSGPVGEPYVNVVCAPPGLMLGTTKKASEMQLSPDEMARFEGGPRPPIPQDTRDEEIYVAQTALIGLHTAGVRNIAITAAIPTPPNKHEVEALLKYDQVICATVEDTEALTKLGVPAGFCLPTAENLKMTVWLATR